jgi:hypothetical protein
MVSNQKTNARARGRTATASIFRSFLNKTGLNFLLGLSIGFIASGLRRAKTMDLQDDEQSEPIPLDDVGFDLDELQAEIHSRQDTKKSMEKVADEIWDSLRQLSSTMSTIPEPRRGRRR